MNTKTRTKTVFAKCEYLVNYSKPLQHLLESCEMFPPAVKGQAYLVFKLLATNPPGSKVPD